MSSWGLELWDQFGQISEHTSKGIDFLDKYNSFLKERCAIEMEYASKLRRLVKNHQYKKKDEGDTQFTYIQAFIKMLNEITDLAGQHELIAENSGEVTNEILKLIKELKEERKKHLTEGQKLQNNLHSSYLQLDKSKKYYEKAFRDAEKAHEHFDKVYADYNLSRADVEKARTISQSKTQQADQMKSEYATNLQRTNELQRSHFNESMPKVFDLLQEMEKLRIQKTKDFIFQSAQIHLNVFPIINNCLQGIISASELVDADKDCDLVIEKYKSGMEPPEDLPFEDLSNPQTDQTSTNSQPSHPLNYSNSITGKDTMKGTLVYAKLKKRAGFFNIFGSNKEEIYADLPPNQRRKKLQDKLNQIQEQLTQEKKVRDGLIKMKQAYTDNNKLGDPTSVDSQLNENSNKLKKLQLEVEKYEKYLSEMTNGKATNNNSNTVNNNNKLNGTQANRSSISEESLSRSASDSSVSHPQATSKNGLNGNLNNKQAPVVVFKQMNNSTSNSNLNVNSSFKSGNLNGHLNGNSSTSSNTPSTIYETSNNYTPPPFDSPDAGHNSKINLSNVDFIDGDQD